MADATAINYCNTHTHTLSLSLSLSLSLTHSHSLTHSLTQRIPMADATAINYCNIPLTALAAAVLLGDSFGRLDVACMVACFVGVMLVVQVLS